MGATTSAGSVVQALGASTEALRAAGVDSPRLDAELLLCEATGWDRARLAADPGAGVPADAGRQFGGMLRRRLRREPVAYILGRKGFRNIELAVNPRVLIPRPETELLVEVAVELAPDTVIDVGTGSGAIALAVADELPGARVTATDSSPGALAVAAANAERLGLADRIELVPGGLAPGEFDLLLANLPYVADAELPGLAPEIREWEPVGALTPGPTGLESIEWLLGEVAVQDAPPRATALEVGEGQAAAVAGLMRRAAYERVETRRDLAGIERVVLGTR